MTWEKTTPGQYRTHADDLEFTIKVDVESKVITLVDMGRSISGITYFSPHQAEKLARKLTDGVRLATGVYELEDLSSVSEEEHGITPVDQAVIERLRDDEPNAYVLMVRSQEEIETLREYFTEQVNKPHLTGTVGDILGIPVIKDEGMPSGLLRLKKNGEIEYEITL